MKDTYLYFFHKVKWALVAVTSLGNFEWDKLHSEKACFFLSSVMFFRRTETFICYWSWILKPLEDCQCCMLYLCSLQKDKVFLSGKSYFFMVFQILSNKLYRSTCPGLEGSAVQILWNSWLFSKNTEFLCFMDSIDIDGNINSSVSCQWLSLALSSSSEAARK